MKILKLFVQVKNILCGKTGTSYPHITERASSFAHILTMVGKYNTIAYADTDLKIKCGILLFLFAYFYLIR